MKNDLGLCKKEIIREIKNSNTLIGRDLHFFESVTSTFDKLEEFKPKEGLTVAAVCQTNGRGRLGRQWNSKKGGIYFSFMLLPKENVEEAPFITLICALGVQKALSKYADCLIKWPNDIVCDGKKLCGILTKANLTGNSIKSIYVGIGINANNGNFCDELSNAVSLKELCGKNVDENKLLAEVLEEISHAYYSQSREQILSSYKKACVNLENQVTIHYANGKGDEHGICKDILPDGSMNVQTKNGIINVNSGEVSVKGIYNFERTNL